MKHSILMNMLQAESQLDKPIQNLSLWKAFPTLLGLLDSSLEISSLTIVHHYAHIVFLYKTIVVSNDIRVIQTFQYLNLQTKNVKLRNQVGRFLILTSLLIALVSSVVSLSKGTLFRANYYPSDLLLIRWTMPKVPLPIFVTFSYFSINKILN